jgi:hypothetical protein
MWSTIQIWHGSLSALHNLRNVRTESLKPLKT